jgi:hypothetical protein
MSKLYFAQSTVHSGGRHTPAAEDPLTPLVRQGGIARLVARPQCPFTAAELAGWPLEQLGKLAQMLTGADPHAQPLTAPDTLARAVARRQQRGGR